WTVLFDSGSGDIAVLPDRVELRQFDGKIGDGQWLMESEFGIPPGSDQSHTTVRFQDVSAQAVTKKIGFLKEYQGELSGDLELGSAAGSGFTARGNLELTDAKLSQTQLFAPLMARLGKLGFSEPVRVQVAFQLAPQVLKLSSLQLISMERTA